MKKFLIVGLFCLMVCCLSACSTCSSCNESISVSGIGFNESSLQLYVGVEYKLEYTISPEDATNTNVLFVSTDESVLTVGEDGTVYALAQGSVSVIVMTEDGEYYDTCYITVIEKADETPNGGQADSDGTQSDEQTDSSEQDDKDNQGEQDEQDEDNTEDQNDDDQNTDGQGVDQDDGQDDDNQDEENQDDYNGDNDGEQEGGEEEPSTIYTITFIADGKVEGTCTFTYIGENFIIEGQEPAVPEKTGYTGKWEEYSLSPKDIIVYAVYTPIIYTATFMFNDIVYDKIPFTVEDTEIEEPEVTTSAGYEVEWESYTLGCEDITINAVITMIEYTITYENTKGAENSNSGTYSVENRFTLEDLTLTGYKFEGWYIDGERVYSIDYLYGNLTITAQWKVLEYEIKFFDEYGNVEIATRTYTAENTDIDIPEIPDYIPDKEGYIKKWEYFELKFDENDPDWVHVVYVKVDE